MTTPRDKLIDSLQDKEFREAYVAEHLHQGFAFQVRVTRKARELTQGDLGDQAGMKQSRISDIEDPSYESLSLKTAERIASALDVALILRLVPYSKFTDFLVGSTTISMGDWTDPIPAFDDDLGLQGGVDTVGSIIHGFGNTLVERQAALPMHEGMTNIVPFSRSPAHSSTGLVSSQTETLKVRVS